MFSGLAPAGGDEGAVDAAAAGGGGSRRLWGQLMVALYRCER
jgi:hypothetical protein